MVFVLQKRSKQAERKRVEARIADYQRIISTGLTDKQLRYETIKARTASDTTKSFLHER
jgi:deoxycytidylate deaminase